MQYQFATQDLDYSDYASGRVFYSQAGRPALPVRLGREVFQRAAAWLKAQGRPGPYALYDPCCGAAYHLVTLAYLHGEEIRSIAAADLDGEALKVAKRNLGLLNMAGLDQRISEIRRMLADYGKESHQEALASALRMRSRLEELNRSGAVRSAAFRADAMTAAPLAPGWADLVLADVPYGWHSDWIGAGPQSEETPLQAMLTALLGGLSSCSLVAVISDKAQKARHAAYRRVDTFRSGRRQVTLLQAAK